MRGLTTTDKLRMLLDITKKISQSLDLAGSPQSGDGHARLADSLRCRRHLCREVLDEAKAAEGEEPCVFQAEAVRGYDIDELTDLHLKLGEGLIGRSR